MDNKKFWKYIEQIDWDHKKVLDLPEEDQLDFCKTAEEKQKAMLNHQTYCCDSAMDGSWGAVAWGREHYEKLWKAISKNPDTGSEQLCDYSYRKGKSGEMFGYRIAGLRVLLGGVEDHYDLDPPSRFVKLLEVPLETVMPMWNKAIRPLVENPEKYIDFQRESIRRSCSDPDTGELVNQEEFDRTIKRLGDTWNEQYAEHVGVDPVVKTYKVRAVFLVEEDVEVKARSPFEALRLAEDWAAENAGEREVMDPHSMYHCEGWEVSEPTDNP